jgi:FkbM family methyltransferase
MNLVKKMTDRRERKRLRRLGRYHPSETVFLGHRVFFCDAMTYASGVDEIFGKKCYAFKAGRPAPVILDCGANIGLAAIYFKQCYPDAKVTCFEADPFICSLLRKNCSSFAFTGLDIHNAAVWTESGTLSFRAEGGFSGRIPVNANDTAGKEMVQVRSIRCRDFLDAPIDFCKLDIEGAEHRVLGDCADKLRNIEHLFVEYHAPAGEPQRLDEILRILSDAHFRYYIKEAFTPRHPFLETESCDGMDLQLNIYARRQP